MSKTTTRTDAKPKLQKDDKSTSALPGNPKRGRTGKSPSGTFTNLGAFQVKSVLQKKKKPLKERQPETKRLSRTGKARKKKCKKDGKPTS